MEQSFIDVLQKIIKCYGDLFAFIISFSTLIATIYIPRKIRIDQQFASLTEQYRSTEMGFAIFSIFNFYEKDCQNNPENIKKKYKERFNREIETPMQEKEKNDPLNTLQFQRRLVAHFYWDLSKLYFESRLPRLSKKQLFQMVETNERQLISLILQMSEANAECFTKCENNIDPPDDEVPMNHLLKRLYDKTDKLT